MYFELFDHDWMCHCGMFDVGWMFDGWMFDDDWTDFAVRNTSAYVSIRQHTSAYVSIPVSPRARR